MARKSRSRRVKSEQSKAMRQTITFGIMALILGLAFVFGVLPVIIRLTAPGDSGISLSGDDTIPPQVPIIAAPVEATSSATFAVSGFGEADSEMVLILNGEEVDKLDADENGEFQFEMSLDPGENTFAIFSIDEAGNESDTTRRYTVTFDATPPTLELDNFSDGQEILGRDNQRYTITGQTDPSSTLFINGRLHRADSEGAFSAPVQLQEGDNEVTIQVTDPAGNTTEEKFTVKFAY